MKNILKCIACLFISFLSGCDFFTPDGQRNEGELLALLFMGGVSQGRILCPTTPPVADVYLADTVTDAPGHTGVGFGDSNRAVNGICGAGSDAGSFDVFSLSATGVKAAMVLEWAGKKVIDGAGIDFMVFENPFQIGGSPTTLFMDQIIVEVGLDESDWCGFAPDYINVADETTYNNNPAKWQNFAGITPVSYNQESNPLNVTDIFNPGLAGGDAFDLANLSNDNTFNIGCSAGLVTDIQTNGFLYLRLTAATDRTNPDTGDFFIRDGISDGPDIDGVIARYLDNR